jgi:hypothetical protein
MWLDARVLCVVFVCCTSTTLQRAIVARCCIPQRQIEHCKEFMHARKPEIVYEIAGPII